MDKIEFLVICRILSDSLMEAWCQKCRSSSHDTALPDQNLEDNSTSFADLFNFTEKTTSIYKWLKNLCRQFTTK
jgi:lauroyl/myristoyl acyltransferase